MRIGLVSTLRTSVPPEKSGSVELIVGLLAEELAQRGHDVTVFASEDSRVSARVLSIVPQGYHHDETIWDWEFAEFMQLGLVYEHAGEFDVINSHVYCYALPFTRLVRTPTVHTFHICPSPDFVRFCGMYAEAHYVVLSEFQRGMFGDVPTAAVIPNAIDIAAFTFGANAGDYLAFLGGMWREKGVMEAIRCSRTAGIPLRMAGPASGSYYKEVLQHEVDGRHIEYLGELDHKGKVELLSGALATVFASDSPEACPLVLLESMACGTPVLAVGSGPVPEIVLQDVGGIYVDDPGSLASAAGRIGSLDREVVRKLAVERFSVSRMADDYLRLFGRIA